MSIELVIQTPSGRIPLQADPKSSLSEVLASIDESSNASSLRYFQTTVHRSQWDTMTLRNLGLQSGARALLILETSGNTDTSNDVNMTTAASNDNTNAGSLLEPALSKILQCNFDQDSQACIVTLIKVIDNVIQKPSNPKVRCIRLANPTVEEKVVSRGGGKIIVSPVCNTYMFIVSSSPYYMCLTFPFDSGLFVGMWVRASSVSSGTAIQE